MQILKSFIQLDEHLHLHNYKSAANQVLNFSTFKNKYFFILTSY